MTSRGVAVTGDLGETEAANPRSPVVLIPGIQGHPEWMRAAARSLGALGEVVTLSLYTVGRPPYFEQWCRQIDEIIDRMPDGRATLVGVSFGGLIAAYYAARRPGRLTALVLASAPSPRWRPDEASARYLAHPRRSLPLFAWRGIQRLSREVWVAFPEWPARARFVVGHVARAIRWPMRPAVAARWVEEWQAYDLAADCRRIGVPTLILTGEAELDRVVRVESSLDYLSLVSGAQHVTLGGTGHLGVLTKPGTFAAAIIRFVRGTLAASDEGKASGHSS